MIMADSSSGGSSKDSEDLCDPEEDRDCR